MEIPVVAGILGLGYYYNYKNDKIKNDKEPKNIYESKRSLKIRQDELKHAEKVWKEPNRIMPGPPKIDPTLLFNKVDYEDNQLPIEFNNYNKNDIFSEINVVKHENKSTNLYNTNSPIAGGQHGISLTGEPINPNKFVHNNMVPFFGGRIKQNVDDKANQTVLEHFTGNVDNYQQKKEIGPLFAAENNVTNPYGSANHTDFEHDRIIPSKIMHNVTPVERVRVGPGLNQGYTSQPSGGFQQANARDYTLPKTVDELRTKNNPKLTYKGRVLSGKGISKPGKIGVIEKRQPDSFFVSGPERWFTTVGAQTAEKQRPNIVLKDVNRRTTGSKKRFGVASHVTGNKNNIRPGFRKSRKQQFKSDGIRHFNAQGKWSAIPKNKVAPGCQQFVTEEERQAQYSAGAAETELHDYGKSRTTLKETERETMSSHKYRGPLRAGDKVKARNDQKARKTRKRFTTNNKHTGHIQVDGVAGYVCDPNDVAKTTMKEQLVDKVRDGNMAPQQPSKMQVYDPNDVTRTTIKEQTVDNNHEGFMNPNDKKSYVYDPDDIAKTTMKETMIDNEHDGFMNPDKKQSYVHDPNDVARTTVKETTIDDNRLGVARGRTQMKCRDPNDKARTTIKETTIAEDVVGAMYQKKGMGYDVTKNEVKNTVRQFTSNNKYSGIAGPGLNEQPQSYEQIYNSTVKSYREQVSKGRTPGGSGLKQFNNKVNATTKKLGDIQNNYLNERGLAPNKVYNSLPQAQECAVTRDKYTAPNEPIQDRLDPGLLDQLSDNPYSMRSLASKC